MEGAAVRVLRPGPRPYVAIGIVFAVATAIAVVAFSLQARWTDAATAAGLMLVVYGAVGFGLARSRIVVTRSGITVCEAFRAERAIRFDDIVASVPRVLGEPDHPVTLDVYTSAGQSGGQEAALRIRLKPYRKEDVRALLAMPALKVTASAPGSWR